MGRESGVNEIEVPLYWFPRDLRGLLSSWCKQYNRGLGMCTHLPFKAHQPFRGSLSSALCVGRGQAHCW